MKNFIFTISLIFLPCFFLNAQSTYFSVGYTGLRMEESYVYSPYGFNISIHKDVNILTPGLDLINSIHVGFYTSDLNRDFLPGYFTTLSVSPKIGYEIISFGRAKVKPFFGPFASYLLGYQIDRIVTDNNRYFNEFRYGFETGVIIDILLSENTVLRIIPYSLQYGNNYYRSGFIEVGININ